MSDRAVKEKALEIINKAVQSSLMQGSQSRGCLNKEEAVMFLNNLGYFQKQYLPYIDSRFDPRMEQFEDKERQTFTAGYFADHTVYIWDGDKCIYS